MGRTSPLYLILAIGNASSCISLKGIAVTRYRHTK